MTTKCNKDEVGLVAEDTVRFFKLKLADMASEALFVQNACNLSAVVHSFSRILTELRKQPDFNGTAWLNKHPISVLFSSKITSLTGSEDSFLGPAIRECEEMAKFGKQT